MVSEYWSFVVNLYCGIEKNVSCGNMWKWFLVAEECKRVIKLPTWPVLFIAPTLDIVKILLGMRVSICIIS